MSLQPSFGDENKNMVQLQLSGDNNENDEWRTIFIYFSNQSELNSFITWLVGMKKHIE